MGISKDTHTNASQFSYLAIVFYVSYLFCEVPHGSLIQRLPIAKYLGACGKYPTKLNISIRIQRLSDVETHLSVGEAMVLRFSSDYLESGCESELCEHQLCFAGGLEGFARMFRSSCATKVCPQQLIHVYGGFIAESKYSLVLITSMWYKKSGKL
jgi:hypothetical protein